MNLEMQAKSVKRSLPLFLSFLLAACHPISKMPPSIVPTTGDSVALVSVVQNSGDRLERNIPTELLVTLQYTLSTRERALLRLDLDQFSTKDTCTSLRHAGIRSGQRQTVATQTAPITFGTHTLQMRITWPGGKTENGAPESGAVSLEVSMRSEQPAYNFLTYRFGTQYCMQF
jgi:hypothetical protein